MRHEQAAYECLGGAGKQGQYVPASRIETARPDPKERRPRGDRDGTRDSFKLVGVDSSRTVLNRASLMERDLRDHLG